MVDMHVIRQKEAKGVRYDIYYAKNCVGDEIVDRVYKAKDMVEKLEAEENLSNILY